MNKPGKIKKNRTIAILFLIAFNLIVMRCSAIQYFVSNSGSDGNNGTSVGTPWQTISRVNSASLVPGDIVSFNGGQTFTGTLNITWNGNSGSRITFNSYGSGMATISGMTTVSGWGVLSGNVYESATISAAQSTGKIVTLNGSFVAIGRFPKIGASNKGYLPYQSASGTSIVSSSMPGTSFVGGQIVSRKVHWVIDVGPVNSQSSNTVATSGGTYTGISGFGFFFQNHLNCLTAVGTGLGEWAFEASTKRLRMFFPSGPGSNVVQLATTPTLVTISSRSFIDFTNLNFVGSNTSHFNYSGSTNNIRIQNCGLYFAGTNMIDAVSGCNNLSVTGCTSDWTNNNFINAGTSPSWTITGNTIRHIGGVAGMGGNGDGKYSCIYDVSTNSSIQNNNIYQTGYVSINFSSINGNGGGVNINQNLVDTFCFIKDDGAAIYTWGQTGASTTTPQRFVTNNIVLHGLGAPDGAGGGNTSAHGIYMDDLVSNVTITGNSCAFNAGSGIYLHNARQLTINNNTTYGNNSVEIRCMQDNPAGPIRQVNMDGNIFFNLTTDQSSFQLFCMNFRSTTMDIGQWGTWNNNYYCRPLTTPTPDALLITARQCNGPTNPSSCTDFFGNLAQWKTFAAPKDQNSKGTPIATTLANLRFEYNATGAAVVKSLGGNNYMDVRGAVYVGSITLQAYTSAVLMRTAGGNSLPVVGAGADQTITLPTNSVSVTGTATDPDGTIASRQWTKLIGGAATITSPTSATTTITGLVQGSYQFQFCATDNAGGSACDVMTVTVNAAPQVPPVSNAGPDRTIQLPTTTTTLNGSGSDADGTVVGYLWTKTGGPATGTIVSATQPVTNITNLTIAGTYTFNLRVTDNQGLTGNDQVTVLVNPAANQPPTVSAGANQTITLPTSQVTVTATASDPDGTIASYLWTKISGPSGGTITSASSASTTITGYTNAGTYIYQVLVTDNGGLTASATTQITVQPAIPPNQPPVANAGADRIITLPTSSLTQVGSATDADGTVTGYLWTKISGTGGAITTPTNSTTSFTGLSAGTYIYQLRATDNLGATGTDQFTITVNAAPNTPPIAGAGPDQVKTLPGQTTATMAGTASDPGGSIVSTVWSQIGGTASTITNANSLTTTITGLTTAGSRTYRLLVTDNLGATDDDTMIILVNPAPNQPPVANAGTDKNITLPTNSVTQVGSGTDPDGTITGYLWTKISGPAAGNIVSATQATTVINNLTIAGTYVYQLRVTDNGGLTNTDQMSIVVNTANTPPIVSAGPNQSITLPTSLVTLTGTASDPGGSIASYQWTKISGPASGTIATPTTASTNVTGYSIAGTYVYQLFVTDNLGLTASSTTQVTVIAANVPPTANAGANQTITLPTSFVTLSGSGSDPDGTIVAYAWAKISGPASGTITSPSSQNTTVTGYSIAGTYVYRLTVTDNGGLTGSSTTQITVNSAPPPNLPPVVNAGTDKVMTLPTNSVNQVGSATDPDGTVVSYLWTKISGPATGTINSPTSATTLLSNLVQGTYIFQLQATDNLGATGTDQATVQVDPIPNVPPTANPGADKNITLPTNTTTVIGSGTDPDGTIVSYLWTKISGPSGGTIATPNQSSTAINSLVQGTYIYQLLVTDNSAATGSDQMTIIVNAAPLLPPVANAGPDQVITLPTTTATLAGSGTDPDGTIVSNVWNWLSGPAVATVTTPSSYTSGVTGLTVAGSYYFKLSVNDNNGLTDTDTMIVLVNPAPNQPPVANAGAAQYTTTPQIVLNGAASSDPDGTITAWLWSRLSGPPQSNIVSASQPVTVVNNLVFGTYVFNLRVTDNSGATANDTVTVRVDSVLTPPSPQWIPPVANAGPDKHPIVCLFCSTTSQVITGSGTSTYGTIVSYTWTKISGPSGGNISSPNTASTNVTSLQRGTYTYSLTVTDNQGYTHSDTMLILVTKNYIIIRNGRLVIVNL